MERERAQSLDEAGLVCRRWRAQVRWAHLTGRTGVEQLASEVDARSMEDSRRSHGEQRYDKHMASNMVLQQQKGRSTFSATNTAAARREEKRQFHKGRSTRKRAQRSCWTPSNSARSSVRDPARADAPPGDTNTNDGRM